ncbi:hypothetical protein TNCT_220291 [Trichonephila clavata]|uniref:Uncharacterized protein n=1 Tax=Trichonephila clavata TaxID=2740835 RepID=A0A8X6J224_TRICU|nr:hypothetical protein TNCT_220291 [Trichonephila clavata]
MYLASSSALSRASSSVLRLASNILASFAALSLAFSSAMSLASSSLGSQSSHLLFFMPCFFSAFHIATSILANSNSCFHSKRNSSSFFLYSASFLIYSSFSILSSILVAKIFLTNSSSSKYVLLCSNFCFNSKIPSSESTVSPISSKTT